MKLDGLKINFLGDSITQGIGASSADTIYHALLAKEANITARNYGISGTRYAYQKGTPKRPKLGFEDSNDFCARYDAMDNDADVVVIFGGVNDYSHGDASLGRFGDTSFESFYGACDYLYRNLLKKYLGKQIVVMTPLHMIGETKVPEIKMPGGYGILRDYVHAIKEVAEYYSIPVLDLYAVSGIQPDIDEVREKFMPDGIHPNDAGHRIIANKLKTFLEAL